MNKGFSLLEVLIALSLASIFILCSDLALNKVAVMNGHISQSYAKIFSS